MKRYPTQDEIDLWLKERERARISIACKLIIHSNNGNVLLVSPAHKDAWQFPGGAMEPREDPKLAVLREATEELSLHITERDISLVDTILRLSPDVLLLMYESHVLLSEDEPIKFQEAELEGYDFVAPHQVMQHISPYYNDFWQHYLANKKP